jgi:hypothetical protein
MGRLSGFGVANSETVAELLVSFFYYWARHHNCRQSVVSIRVGRDVKGRHGSVSAPWECRCTVSRAMLIWRFASTACYTGQVASLTDGAAWVQRCTVLLLCPVNCIEQGWCWL